MNLEKSIKHIVILMAMAEEAEPIIDALGLVQMPDLLSAELPFLCFQTNHKINSDEGDEKITLITSGTDPRFDVDNIGTQAATLMAYTAIQFFAPDLIISAGTAGGFAKRGAKIGTVYLSDKEFVFHDRRVPIPGFAESGVGSYPALSVRGMSKQLNLPYGVVSTGSSLQKSELDIAVIEEHQAVAKEMEAAAIAWVCWLHQQAFVAVKSITNLLDEGDTSEEQFLENLSVASRCLAQQLQKVIQYCVNNTLSGLSEQ